jgi:cytochrome oxidase Cu insertion factor (SCO1/SenC/PrrC family)
VLKLRQAFPGPRIERNKTIDVQQVAWDTAQAEVVKWIERYAQNGYVSGDPAETAKVITSYRVYAKKIPTKDGDYTMDHTALIYLMDREGRFVSPFNLKRTPEEAAADLKKYL